MHETYYRETNRPLALSLLMTWVLADDEDHTAPTHDLALFADTFDAARTFIINRGQPTAPHKDRDTTGSPEV